MRIINKLILAAVLAAGLLPGAGFASGPDTTTLRVYIQDDSQNPVPNAQVMLVNYGMNGPTSASTISVTNAQGFYTFTISTGMSYNLYVDKNEYSPTMRDQFNNPDPSVQRWFWAMDNTPISSTFTLTHDLAGTVGQIQLPFLGATHGKVLSGSVNFNGIPESGFFGMVIADGTGAGTLTVDNVPYAAANTYNIGVYDPDQNRGVNRNVSVDLNSGSSPLAFATANFATSVPPARVDNNSVQDAGAFGVAGVVQELGYSTTTVPYMGLNFNYCSGYGASSIWANTDANGSFKLTGLTPGVTYYASVTGGCTWSQNGPGACFAPYLTAGVPQNICLANPPAPGINDFIYLSTADTQYVQIQLAKMPKSTGQIKVCIKSTSGFPIPNSNINLSPDGSPWPVNAQSCNNPNNYNNYFSTNFVMNQGFSNANMNTGPDGCATLDGLPSGNYMVNIWTPFTGSNSNGSPSYNGGADTQFNAWGNSNNSGNMVSWSAAHCSGYGSDDFRVAVDTDPATNGGQTMHVYNSSNAVQLDGDGVALSSLTYTAVTGLNTSGEVKGTVKFPSVVDLSKNPIVITVSGNCMNNFCPGGNFTAITDKNVTQSTYSIHVSSGYAYYMNVAAVGWGRVNRTGSDSIHLESAAVVTADMSFAPAGILNGTLYKPDGSVFTPAANQYVWIDADSNNAYSSAQLQKDGTFSMTDVLPGVNRINLGSSANGTAFNYSLPSPAPTVTIVAGSTYTLNLNLVNANNVGVTFDPAKLPDTRVVASGGDLMLGYKAVPLPAGSVFNSDTIIKMLTGGDSDMERALRYAPAATGPSENNPCGYPWAGGFCPGPLPSPAVYDIYLMRSGDFGKDGAPMADVPYPHFTMMNSVKNVVVDTAHSTSSLTMGNCGGVCTSSGVLVDLTPADMHARGNTTLFGSVTAANFFRQADYDATGGNFDNFVKYLPVMALYDDKGAFAAAGIVIPSPKFIAEHNDAFNQSYAQGYAAMKALLAQAGSLGYEIRDLAPAPACYTAVMSSPNYPHYQARVCMGVSGSTTTLNVNLDTAVGAGATVIGVVKSSATVPAFIPNASVELDMEGSPARTAVTDSSGAFRFDGISGGLAKILISASGYAKTTIEQELSDSHSYQENVFLFSAPGSITGTVYSQKLPYAKVQAGAQIVAYDDTYNGLHPSLALPLLKTMTGADGVYTLDGLLPDHLYKVFLKVTGKYTLEVDTTATAGVLGGVDFTMLPKPLDLELFARKGDVNYEFTVLNPKDFKGGNAIWGAAPLDPAHVSTLTLTNLSSGQLYGSIPLTSLLPNQTYVLQGVAVSLSNKVVVKELLFGKNYTGNSQQSIDDLMLGDDSDDGTGHQNNEVSVDKTGGDPSALFLPAGALISTVAVVPSCSFTAEAKDVVAASTKTATLPAGASLAANLYTVSLSSVAQTDRNIELTLAYDKSITDTSTLGVSQYNSATGNWETVQGLATVNPLKGTVTVKLKKLASVLSVRNTGPQAEFDGKRYVVKPMLGGGSSASGTYTVLNYVGGNLPAGSSKMKVFNYPNPFNLKTKNMSNNHGATMPATTYGTMIHVEVPAGNDGPCHIRIYTLAGELVKDISDTCTGGKYNYFAWDGRNKDGQEVANGVYYGVVDLSGSKPDRKDATFKMAVIK